MRFSRCLLLALTFAAILRADFSPSGNSDAIALYRQKKNAEAREAFEKLTAADPANAEAFFYLGLIALREKRIDDAIPPLEKAVELDPGCTRYLIEAGQAYGQKATNASLFSQLGWAEKARTVLEKAVALEPQSLLTNSALVEFYRRAPAVAGGGMSKAYAQAESFRKHDLVGGTHLVVDLYLRERKFTEAFDALDAALAIHPDAPALVADYGRAAAESGQNLDRAAAHLQRVLAASPSLTRAEQASAWFYLGEICVKQNVPNAARAAYEAALRAEPAHRKAAEALQKLSGASATTNPAK